MNEALISTILKTKKTVIMVVELYNRARVSYLSLKGYLLYMVRCTGGEGGRCSWQREGSLQEITRINNHKGKITK